MYSWKEFLFVFDNYIFFSIKSIRKVFILVSIIGIITTINPAYGFKRYRTVKKYDQLFKKYSKRYFGASFDWHFFKAQAVAESRLRTKAKSHVGAIGIMQIMPKTFKEIRKRNKNVKGSSLHPKWNISAGIYYDRQIWKLFKAKRPLQDRINFMFASYNAGKGNIIKAQKIAKKRGMNENIWSSIEKTLPMITHKDSKETIGYIKKIKIIKEKL